MAVLTRNIRPPGQRLAYNNHSQRHDTSISSVHLDIGPEDNNWLKDAWVGHLKNPAMFDRLDDELLWEIGMNISPKYIGEDLVLLLGLTNAGVEQVMNGRQHGGASMFYSMEKWSPSLCIGFRLTWVQCWGIPLQAWDMKYIQKILVPMGEMVDMDDDVEDKRRLDQERVLVKTPWRPTIKHTIDVHIGDECFKVFVVEEYGGGSHDYRRR